RRITRRIASSLNVWIVPWHNRFRPIRGNTRLSLLANLPIFRQCFTLTGPLDLSWIRPVNYKTMTRQTSPDPKVARGCTIIPERSQLMRLVATILSLALVCPWAAQAADCKFVRNPEQYLQ